MKLTEHLFRLLAPARCLGCTSEGSLLCFWCLETGLPSLVPRCYVCGKLSSQSVTCAAHKAQTSIRQLWTRTDYEATARSLVHEMKFAYNLEAADIIGRELAALLPALHPDTLVVPIPTSTTHVRARGFDHAQKIAQYVAKDSNLHPLNALRRTDQKRQVGASRATRVQQIRGIFRVVSSVKNAHILLVDDVITTGATIEEAARTLKNAGAKTINAVVFAKTV